MKFAGAEPLEEDCDPGRCPVCQDNCLEYAEEIPFPMSNGVYYVYRCPCGHITGQFEELPWYADEPYEDGEWDANEIVYDDMFTEDDCGLMADGFCSFAGSEHCDWHCPLNT